MPASVRLKLFSSELHWLWHNCALSLVYASVNEVLVLLCQLLCRFGSEWWRWYLRAGEECSCNPLIVCQKSYIFLPWTVNWAALMVLVLLEHSPKGAPGSVLCSALGCSLHISPTFLLQGSSGKLIKFQAWEQGSCSFSSPFAKGLMEEESLHCGSMLSASPAINLRLLIQTCLPSSLEPRRSRWKQSVFPSWIWQDCDTWKGKKINYVVGTFPGKRTGLRRVCTLWEISSSFYLISACSTLPMAHRLMVITGM